MKQLNVFRFHFYTYRFFYLFFFLGFIAFGILGYLWFDLNQTSQLSQENIEYYYISLFSLLLILHIGASLYESVFVSKYYLQVHINRKDYIISSLTHMFLLSLVTTLLLSLLNGFLIGFVELDNPVHTMIGQNFIVAHILWFLLFLFSELFLILLISFLQHLKRWLLILVLLLMIGAFTYIEMIEHLYREAILYLLYPSFDIWVFVGFITGVLLFILLYILRFRKIAIYYY